MEGLLILIAIVVAYFLFKTRATENRAEAERSRVEEKA